jgi:RimJ/RimL family protein N-acetyltransferase
VSDTFRGFDAQPTLRGELLEVRPLHREDFDKLYAAASDPLIWEQHPEPDRWREDIFRRYFDEQLASGGAVLTIDRATGAVVGMSRFHGYDEQRSEVEIGWTFLARSHWGGTYNRELKDLMLTHAFRFVRSVVFLVGPENLRSQRAVEKVGAVRSGLRRDAYGRESFVYRIDASTPASGRGT